MLALPLALPLGELFNPLCLSFIISRITSSLLSLYHSPCGLTQSPGFICSLCNDISKSLSPVGISTLNSRLICPMAGPSLLGSPADIQTLKTCPKLNLAFSPFNLQTQLMAVPSFQVLRTEILELSLTPPCSFTHILSISKSHRPAFKTHPESSRVSPPPLLLLWPKPSPVLT